MKTMIGTMGLVPLLAGCGVALGAAGGVHYRGGYGGEVHDAGYAYGGGSHYDREYGRRVSYRRLPVPRHDLPAPGRCRVWLPGVAPAYQPRPGSCRSVERRVQPGSWLLVRPFRDPGVVELVRFDHRRPRIKKRYYYDVRTGRRINPY